MSAQASSTLISQRLSRHRKGDLIEIAREAGMSFDEDLLPKMLSRQIAALVAEHMADNAAALALDDRFARFFLPNQSPAKRAAPPAASATAAAPPSSSPAGRVSRRLAAKRFGLDPAAAAALSPAKQEARSEPKPEPESEPESGPADENRSRRSATPVTPASAVFPRSSSPFSSASSSVAATPTPQPRSLFATPSASAAVDALNLAALATTPREVGRVVEAQTTKMRAAVAEITAGLGLAAARDSLRHRLSSTAAVAVGLVAAELACLLSHTVPRTVPMPVPAIGFAGLPAGTVVHLPDLFVLLTAPFWKSLLVWEATSVLVPLLVAYFVNLTARAPGRARRRVDPLVFNITKAVLALAVYARAQGMSLRAFPDEAVDTVVAGLPGGSWQLVVLGSVVGAVVSVYEAVLSG